MRNFLDTGRELQWCFVQLELVYCRVGERSNTLYPLTVCLNGSWRGLAALPHPRAPSASRSLGCITSPGHHGQAGLGSHRASDMCVSRLRNSYRESATANHGQLYRELRHVAASIAAIRCCSPWTRLSHNPEFGDALDGW